MLKKAVVLFLLLACSGCSGLTDIWLEQQECVYCADTIHAFKDDTGKLNGFIEVYERTQYIWGATEGKKYDCEPYNPDDPEAWMQVREEMGIPLDAIAYDATGVALTPPWYGE